MKFHVKQFPIAKLVPYATNPRRNDQAVERMAAAIKEFGFRVPLIALNDGSVIDGHLRLKAAMVLGMKSVPVILADDLSEEQIKAFRLSINRSAEWAEWDEELLAEELRALAESDYDLDLTGFDATQLDKLLADPPQSDPDDVPEPPAKPVTKPGDLWLLGDHRLMCGDCTEAGDVARLLGGGEPNLMVTDSPYGVNYDPTWRDDCGGQFGDGKTVMRGKVVNDHRASWVEAYAKFPGDVAYCWHPPGANLIISFNELLEVGLVPRWQIIWVKPHFVLTRGHYHLQHEPCWYAVRKGKTAGWIGDRRQTSVWEIAGMNPAGGGAEVKLGHGTQKPVECMERPIRNHKGDVYDPFVGSGTTIIAAEREKRRCFAMELDPAYCDVAVKRWETYTGKKAKLSP